MAAHVGRLLVGRRALVAAAGAGGFGAAIGLVDHNKHESCRTWAVAGRIAATSGARSSGTVRCEASQSQLRHGTCRLRDGRLLAYHVEGSGAPVIAFHGMGSSRLTWLGEQPLQDICPGVQIVAVDRPGYGNSSPPPFGYSYADFARDIEELADSLKLPRFGVVGHSSGGPYALAAAALLSERVTACAAVSSDAPYCHPVAPRELQQADDLAQSSLLGDSGLYGKDARAFAEGMRSSYLKKGVPAKAHAWKSGVDGWLCDYTLERIPWSFAVERIALGPRLSIWVGSDDFECIKVGAPFLQQLIPGSQLRVVEGGDHGFKSDPKHLAAILRELVQHA